MDDYIYMLQLTDGNDIKWYIDSIKCEKSHDVLDKIETHFYNINCEFTTKYYPTKIYKIIKIDDIDDTDKYIKKYMKEYGIDNVRGGSYTKLELTNDEKTNIQIELLETYNNTDDDNYNDDTLTYMNDRISYGNNEAIKSNIRIIAGIKYYYKMGYLYKPTRLHKIITIDNFIFNKCLKNTHIYKLMTNYIDSCARVSDKDSYDYFRQKKTELENEILNFLINMCYIKLHNFIKTTYKFEHQYFISNFSTNKTIHSFNNIRMIIIDYPMKELVKDKNIHPTKYNNDTICFNTYAHDITNRTVVNTCENIITVTFEGELWYA